MEKKLLTTLAIASVVLITGCNNKGDHERAFGYGQSLKSLTTVGSTTALAPGAVDLGVAGNFVILSKAGITDVPPSVITGDIGTSPISGTAIGVTCAEVSGTIYTVSAAGPLPCRVINPGMLTVAILNMQAAYTDAAGRAPDFTELYAGDISGKTLAPGVYKWSNSVLINTDVTLSGSATDVWIFEIAGDLNIASGGSVSSKVFIYTYNLTIGDLNIAAGGSVSSGIKVVLSGGALASNVFWQVGGPIGATLGTYSTFNGIILSAKQIIMKTGAVLNGRALAQTQVTLDQNTVTVSGTSGGGTKPPEYCRDFVTGGGWINGNSDDHGHKNDKATFGVSGGIKNGKFWGQLSFNDHNGTSVKSTSVTDYIVIDSVTRQIEGIAKVGRISVTYTVVVKDLGEPGRNDSFSLVLSNGYSASGTLMGGNIQLHKECGDSHHNGDKENYYDRNETDGNNNCDNDQGKNNDKHGKDNDHGKNNDDHGRD